MEEVRLLRKFNCKKKIDYKDHLLLILRVQLIFELILIVTYCIINLSFRFHLTHVYATSFWESEQIATSNLALSITTLLLLPYIVKLEKSKGFLVKDLIGTMLVLHILFSIIYSHTFTLTYLIFILILSIIAISMGAFCANFEEQNNLHREIMQIESEDRKSLKNNTSQVSISPNCELVEEFNEEL